MFVYRNLKAKAGAPTWQYGERPKQPRKGADGKPVRFAEILVSGVTFKDSPASQKRCLANIAAKNGKSWDVHAYACGEIVAAVTSGTVARPQGKPVAITYDKYGCGHFVRKDTGAVITHCAYVVFAADGHSYAFGDIR
jgi:hypothetical protein